MVRQARILLTTAKIPVSYRYRTDDQPAPQRLSFLEELALSFQTAPIAIIKTTTHHDAVLFSGLCEQLADGILFPVGIYSTVFC
jgi:hypothetical protein